MNENIINSLEQYVKDVNPQYAILLSGSWGCGKTHFIEAWIKQYNTSHINPESSKSAFGKKKSPIILKPIKVSLFGLQTNAELIEAINRELSPIVFNLKKYGLIAAKVISRVALKADAIGGFQSPIEAEFSALDTLFPANEDVSIKGEKVIVLDDIERCKIPTAELFGFIDLLLHKYQCKIIIIGDEIKYEQEGNGIYQQYKEKIIGQTLVIQKDSNAAFEAFTKEIENISNEAAAFVRENKERVLDVFNASGYSNLRSLKQSLHQFAFLYSQLNAGAEDFKRELLANYVAISMELHNNHSINLEKMFQGLLYGGPLNKDDGAVYVLNKYQFIEGRYNCRLLKGYDIIFQALKNGNEISKQINEEIGRRNNKPLSEQIKNYYTMSNAEFSLKTNMLYDYLNADVKNLYEYVILLYYYCKMQHKKLIPDNETFVKECTDKCIEILSSISNLNAFVPYESSVRNVFYSAAYEPSIPLFEKVKEALLDIIDQQKVALKDNLTSVIENLSDESIEVFKDLIMGSNPYNEASYDLLPIFDKINTDAFINGYLSLSNQNKDVVCEYIGYRYRKFQYSQGIRERLLPDKDNLQVIGDKLKVIEQQLVCIDKLQVNKFITMTEEAIIELQKPDIR